MMMIRSQDKRVLVPIGSLTISDFQGKSTIENTNSDMSVVLGYYVSDSRCIEILDEIEERYRDYSEYGQLQVDIPKVYWMPKE